MIFIARLFLVFILFTPFAADVMAMQQKELYSSWLRAIDEINRAIKNIERLQASALGSSKEAPELAKKELEAAKKELESAKADLAALKAELIKEHKKH